VFFLTIKEGHFVQRNPSTGKIIRSSSSGKVLAVNYEVDESFADSECSNCCFVPPPVLDDWDNETTYQIGDLVVRSDWAWSSLQNNNLNHVPYLTEGTWWEKLCYGIPCEGNDGYDDYPPFGGCHKTPKYYTMHWDDSLGNINCPISGPIPKLEIQCPPDWGARYVWMAKWYVACDVLCQAYLWMDCESTYAEFSYKKPGDTWEIACRTDFLAGCTISGSGENIWSSPARGTLSWHPGWYEGWTPD